MFERFTYRARRSVALSADQARMLGHNCVGTEHVLLGLLAEGGGVAAAALEGLRIEVEDVRSQVAGRVDRGQHPSPEPIPLTPHAKQVLELSSVEARQLGHDLIGTGHILLALIGEGDGGAVQVLLHHGADLDQVREQVLRLLSSPDAEAEDGGPSNWRIITAYPSSTPKC